MRQQSVSSRKVHNPTASEKASYTPGRLPCFVQLLARQATGLTHRARQPIEERVAGEAPTIVGRESRSRREVEGQNSFSAFTPLARIWMPMRRRMNDDRQGRDTASEKRVSRLPSSRALLGANADYFFSDGC